MISTFLYKYAISLLGKVTVSFVFGINSILGFIVSTIDHPSYEYSNQLPRS